MKTTPTDRELITQVLQGNQQPFAELVSRYQNMMFTVAFRLTNNREDAEELAQSAFVKAYRSLSDYRGDSKFSTWLYTIVHSLGLSFLRKKKLDTLSMEQDKVRIAAENKQAGGGAIMVEAKSKTTMVNEAIAMLSPDDAKVLTLFYQGEQSLEEIGSIMGIDPNTAKVKLHRARTRLKQKMETYFAEEVRNLYA
jgi:RNA polymerase sigma-70 factor (ECF subfamily)